MKSAVVTIQGFRQRLGRKTGLFKLWQKLRAKSSKDHCTLQPAEWDLNIKSMAYLLHNSLDEGAGIAIYAYSWGAGRGAARLCKHLDKLGRRVRYLVMIDPVYYSWLLPTRWLAMFRSPSIELTDNIDHLQTISQRNNLPAGHRVIAGNSAFIATPICLDCEHADMDDHPIVHEICESTTDHLIQEYQSIDDRFRCSEGQFQRERNAKS